MFRPTFVTVDLDALARNLSTIRAQIKSDTHLMAVVKTDAYGHGILPVSCCALRHGADQLCVATPDEGALLRQNGITAPILVLGGIAPEGAAAAAQYDLTQAVFFPEMVQWLDAQAIRCGRNVNVHLKVDTGMARVGVRDVQQVQEVLDAIRATQGRVRLTGAFTHFAMADEAGSGEEYTHLQLALLDKVLAPVRTLYPQALIHASNSAALFDYPQARFDGVRPGIALYGVTPSQTCAQHARLYPLMRWQTRIVYLKEIPQNQYVSYGCTYQTQRTTRVATLPVGYGDGYRRSFSNRAQVLIHGKRAPVIGRVCMDQIMVDVTDIPQAQLGDEVVLMGQQDKEIITAWELARLDDTIPYEIMLGITSRVPRVYVGQDAAAQVQ